jgi:uncharacterized Zn-finger protein
MAERIFLIDDVEVYIVDELDVACDGGSMVLGHPVEFMTLAPKLTIVCPYCGRRYLHSSHPEAVGILREAPGQQEPRAAAD